MKNSPASKAPLALRWLRLLVLVGAMGGGIYYINTLPKENGLPAPLRRVLEKNEQVAGALLSPRHLVDTFPRSRAIPKARVNGKYGMGGPSDTAGYSFYVGKPGTGDTTGAPRYTLAALRRLPHQDLTFDFKCVEGWSQITQWGGYRLADFVRATGMASKNGQPVITGREPWAYKYIGLRTMDGGYYVGLDMPSALHPQTLLCTELSGKLLPKEQGAPLRLIIPVKYGVKSIKKIGMLYASDTPPKDYWYDKGYAYDLTL
jgi:Oxidoreductase molybdopterin binding domain